MESFLKVSKKGKYIQIDYKTNLDYVPMDYCDYVWCSNVEDARLFIDFFYKIKEKIKEVLEDKKYKIDYRLIILQRLKSIESISSGFDIRSKKTIDELAEDFVFSYNKKLEESIIFCKETIEYFNEKGKFESYFKNTKKYDKYNELNKNFYLNLKPLKLEDFNDGTDLFHKVNVLIDELIKKI